MASRNAILSSQQLTPTETDVEVMMPDAAPIGCPSTDPAAKVHMLQLCTTVMADPTSPASLQCVPILLGSLGLNQGGAADAYNQEVMQMAVVSAVHSIAEAAPVALLGISLTAGQRGLLQILQAMRSSSCNIAEKLCSVLKLTVHAAVPALHQTSCATLLQHLMEAMQTDLQVKGSSSKEHWAAQVVCSLAAEVPALAAALQHQHLPALLVLLQHTVDTCTDGAAAAARNTCIMNEVIQTLSYIAASPEGRQQLLHHDLGALLRTIPRASMEYAHTALGMLHTLTVEAAAAAGEGLMDLAVHTTFSHRVLCPHVQQLLQVAQQWCSVEHAAADAAAAMHIVLIVARSSGAGCQVLVPHLQQLLAVMQQRERPAAALLAGETLAHIIRWAVVHPGAALGCSHSLKVLQAEQLDRLLALMQQRSPTMHFAAEVCCSLASSPAGQAALAVPQRLQVLVQAMLRDTNAGLAHNNNIFPSTTNGWAFKAVIAVSEAAARQQQVVSCLPQLLRVALLQPERSSTVVECLARFAAFREGKLALVPCKALLQQLLDSPEQQSAVHGDMSQRVRSIMECAEAAVQQLVQDKAAARLGLQAAAVCGLCSAAQCVLQLQQHACAAAGSSDEAASGGCHGASSSG